MTRPTLVFDLDGTLADTAPDLGATLNVILAREGLEPLRPHDIRPIIGAGARALLERGLAAGGSHPPPQRVSALFDDFLAYYGSHIAEKTRLFPGADAALRRFDAAGWHLAICTNKLEALSNSLLSALGVAKRFSAICGGDTFKWSKPDPRHLTMTIVRAGGDPARAVMVGDSMTDIATAKAAGVPIVAVNFGYTDIPVAALEPNLVIGHFDELYDAVTQLLVVGARPE